MTVTASVTGSPTGASAIEPFISREMPPVRQVEQEVDDPRRPPCLPEKPIEQGRDLRSDAGQSDGAEAKSGSRREGRRDIGERAVRRRAGPSIEREVVI